MRRIYCFLSDGGQCCFCPQGSHPPPSVTRDNLSSGATELGVTPATVANKNPPLAPPNPRPPRAATPSSLGNNYPLLDRRLSARLFPDLAEFKFVSRFCLKSVLWFSGKDRLLISGQGFKSPVTSSGQSSSSQLLGSLTIRLKPRISLPSGGSTSTPIGDFLVQDLKPIPLP
ncbi:hypothetical protein ATANTOWER_031901 [Ataeniobius toweri]|uniref:Uncharacterized protein n=1 Tax=Ataeniobius toweri TaxID=208326 RepID=A0ABU7CGJ3_9TELE|nr:hypothetical protein [Ataeniobius toweri]